MRLDPFTSVLILVVALASFFPCEGQVAVWFALLTKLAVALLFFMHGAKLSRQNLLAGLGHWRLHLVVMASTFLLFPLLGSIAWFVAGRPQPTPPPSAFPEYDRPGRMAPGDSSKDEAFLRDVRARAEEQRARYQAEQRRKQQEGRQEGQQEGEPEPGGTGA